MNQLIIEGVVKNTYIYPFVTYVTLSVLEKDGKINSFEVILDDELKKKSQVKLGDNVRVVGSLHNTEWTDYKDGRTYSNVVIKADYIEKKEVRK